MNSGREGLGTCQLPISRIRTIMKSSPEVNSIGNDSLFLIAKATELFVQNLTQQAHKKSSNKSMLDYNDLAEIINKREQLQFLQDWIFPANMQVKNLNLKSLTGGSTTTATNNNNDNEDIKKTSRKSISMKNDPDKKQKSSTFDLYHSEAITFQSIGEFKKAIRSYTKALDVKPGDKNCLVSRGRCYLKIGDPERALNDANDIQSSDPQYVKSLLIKADALHELMQFEYALMFYHRGLRLRPEIQDFKQGVQRAQEAIDNSIGEKSGIVLDASGDLSFFAHDLEMQKRLKLKLAPSSVVKSKKNEKPDQEKNSSNKSSSATLEIPQTMSTSSKSNNDNDVSVSQSNNKDTNTKENAEMNDVDEVLKLSLNTSVLEI